MWPLRLTLSSREAATFQSPKEPPLEEETPGQLWTSGKFQNPAVAAWLFPAERFVLGLLGHRSWAGLDLRAPRVSLAAGGTGARWPNTQTRVPGNASGSDAERRRRETS